MAVGEETRRLIEAVASAVDVERPGLRERNLEDWMSIVAWRCHQQDARIGRKSAGNGRPISKDTVGVLAPEFGPSRFHAVSIARDDHAGGNQRRWLEYGLVGSEQVWSRPSRPASEPTGPPPPPPPPPPPSPPQGDPADAQLEIANAVDGVALAIGELTKEVRALSELVRLALDRARA